MTSLFKRIAGPLAAAILTATVFTAGLWIQRSRNAWPFVESVSGETLTTNPADQNRNASVADSRVPIAVTPATMQQLGIRLATVARESLTQEVRAVATVVPDESRISHVHTRVSGWVEHLDVNTTGEMVRAGQPLAHIFSQELFSSQTEYLAIRKATSASGITSAVVAGGRTRLSVLGMTPADIDTIEQTNEPKRLITVAAPRSGIVINRGVTVGTAVDPSTTLLTIADLSRVWILAEVPEANIANVNIGTRAMVDFPASGRAPFETRIDFIYPTLSERTRTLRVRLSAANSNGALRPGLYGMVAFESVGTSVITVPRDAVVDTGQRQHVFVADGDMFTPRTVTLGVQLADRVEVRDGLAEGERVVAAGVFLLDSESRLRATGGAGGHAGHGGTPAPKTQATPAQDPHAGHRQ
jgi:membrane fusion protein, copper/silver efflux system